MVVAEVALEVGGQPWRVRCLRDRLQAADPMFGELWPAGLALAEKALSLDIAGKRILEVGCGLALPSMVLKRRGADITASDHHPQAEEFLRANCELNGLAPISFKRVSWQEGELGRFDLLIGADLVYERGQPEVLVAFLRRHAARGAQIVIADPGRRQLAELRRRLDAFACSEERFAPRGRILTFRSKSC